MAVVSLRTGPLDVPGYLVRRSGLRWLRPDGHPCQAGEVVAFCNLALDRIADRGQDPDPFITEWRDLQVAFVTRVAGRLKHAAGTSMGGVLDQQPLQGPWIADDVVGTLSAADNAVSDIAVSDRDPGELRLLMLAGRRMSQLAEVRSGLMSGWHDRSRAWWGEGDAAHATLLGLGICEQTGVLGGEQGAFLELVAAAPGPAQAVLVQDDPLVPCARVLLEQMFRTDQDRRAIAEDMARGFADAEITAGPGDLIFAGALLAGLQRTPLAEGFDILTRAGVRRSHGADAILLSLNAELPVVARHRRLGYTVCCYPFRMRESGAAVRAWFRAHFDRITVAPEDTRRDYDALFQAVRRVSDARILVMNSYSTSVFETVASYQDYAQPLSATLSTVRAKTLNLMLHDLARVHDLDIVDLDSIVAHLGAQAHLPDGVHQSGPLQAAVRAEIVRLLSERGVRGFG